jgi:hypothetical protein
MGAMIARQRLTWILAGLLPELTEAPDLLPPGWIGDQAYRLSATGTPAEDLQLAPFAEAGQTGADVAVWLAVRP